jgi:hypothetical protein
VTVAAAYSKRRREDVLPLRQGTAAAIRAAFDGTPGFPMTPAFPNMPSDDEGSGADLLRPDLAAAEIPNPDAAGRVIDFHALRHSFISALAAGGVHPKTVQELARHSDINLTMNVYTHSLMDAPTRALEVLPDLTPPVREAEAAKATGTDGNTVNVTDGAPNENTVLPSSLPFIRGEKASKEERFRRRDKRRNPLPHKEKPLSGQGLKGWLPGMDSNHDYLIQSQASYH